MEKLKPKKTTNERSKKNYKKSKKSIVKTFTAFPARISTRYIEVKIMSQHNQKTRRDNPY